MPTNRPFFANFFAAFRARTSPTFQAKSSSTTSSTTLAAATAQLSTTSGATTTTILSSSPRTITAKSSQETSTQGGSNVGQNTSRQPGASSPFSAAAAVAAVSSHAHSHAAIYPTPLSRSPGTSSPLNTHSFSPTGGSSTPYSSPPRGRQRRGSDSSNSSGGFMDALGREKWYIGGRTAGGEERFYRLGLVTGEANRRISSADRLSL